MSSKRAAALVGALATTGVAVSAYISRVHQQIAASQTPGCDVNETFTCTVILSSKYAYLFGSIPVAWLALATYLVIGGIAIAMALAMPRAVQRRRAAGFILAVAIGAAIYSIALAWIATAILRAVCLFCATLYVVNAGLLVASALLFQAVRHETARSGRGRAEESFSLVRWSIGGAAIGVSIVAALFGWEAMRPRDVIPADFKKWYLARPMAEQPPSGGHAKGDPSSPVVIAEFSDFECGHCAQIYRAFKSVWPRYRDDLRIEFHHYPLDSTCNPAMARSFHQNACLAAYASECAAAQDAFWPYHDLLFDNQGDLSRDNLLRFADQVGLDRAAFEQCIASDATREAVARDVAEGTRLEIKSTPTLFVNGRTVVGALEEENLEHVIRIERDIAARRN